MNKLEKMGCCEYGVRAISITIFSIMTLSIKGLFETFSTTKLRIMTISIPTIRQYAECHYAECRVFLIVMLNVIMLSVVMLNVVAP